MYVNPRTGISTIGFKELAAAVKRNPKMVNTETKKFLTRGMSKYKKGIISNPWRVGGVGGGAPTDSQNMRDQHVTRIKAYSATIGPNLTSTPYARYVHEGTSRMKGRPWLDYVKRANDQRIASLYKELLKNITSDLAK